MQDADVPLSIVPGSPSWPPELDPIEQPPSTLWLRGRVELLARRPRVAIVGTRSPSPYGEAQARRFATELAVRGVPIVSGLARGVDQAAHEAALEVGGATIAVLGCGVDRPWPAGPLAGRMAREGLLLSELAPGTPPRRHHFPLRNRLISALAEVVLVAEAAFASGSLITARWAADQGRTVFAIPGRVDQPMARGCHRLLSEGARLAEDPDELLEELGLRGPPVDGSPPGGRTGGVGGVPGVVDALEGETLGADEVAERTGLPIDRTLADLARAELEGRVARCPGGLWRVTHPPRSGGGAP